MEKKTSIIISQDEITEQEDMNMLSLVVDAALHNESIAETYPKFYKRMMADKRLYQIFADMMAVIRDKSPLPDFGSANLSFLHRNSSIIPVIKQTGSDFWETLWELTPVTLDQLFAPALLIHRSGQMLLDVESTILLYNVFEAGGETWEATLEALAHPDAPGQVELFLTVVTEMEPLSPLQAMVQWGDYQQTAVLDTFGRVHFPLFAVDRILNEGKTAVSQNLYLKLQTIL